MATPIKGPAEPCNKATATPVPEVNAHKTPIHKERTLPLKKKKNFILVTVKLNLLLV